MGTKKYIIKIAIFLAAFPMACYPQSNMDSVKAAFKKITKIYEQAPYLSFNMDYTYSTEAKPLEYLDSLEGKVSISNGSSHMVIANTETICDSNYSVILFKDEHLMYLSKSIVKRQTYNPVAMLDSFLAKLSLVDVSIAQKNNNQIITIVYPPATGYKTAQFFIDMRSGLLSSTRYVLKSSLVTSPNGKISTTKILNDDWVVMKCNFSHYQKNKLDNSEFDTSKYFTKSGKEWVPTESFKQYKVFIGSPDL